MVVPRCDKPMMMMLVLLLKSGRLLGSARNGARRPNRDCVKTNRIRLSLVNPSAVTGSERSSTARRISENEQNSSVRHRPVRCVRWLETCTTASRLCQNKQNSSVRRQTVRSPPHGTPLDGQTPVRHRPILCPLAMNALECCKWRHVVEIHNNSK